MQTVLLAVLALFTARGIEWQPSFEAALAQARDQGRVVFIAINMDGERANDRMVAEIYPDATLGKLASHTVSVFASKFDHGSGEGPCPRSGTVRCADHQAVEKAVRLGLMGGGEVIAPQHVFLAPDGKIILSVPYQVSASELEWCFVTALRAVDPAFKWQLSGSARAPRRLLKETVPSAATGDQIGLPTAPTKKELDDILDRLKRGEKPWEMWPEVALLLISDDERAQRAIESILSSKQAGRRGYRQRLIHAIGQFSSPSWWEVVDPYLGDADVEVRQEAAVALEQLAAEKALSPLLKRFAKEEDASVRAELVRAIAACGAGQSRAEKLIKDRTKKDRDASVRASAVVAAAYLENREAVREIATLALDDKTPSMRAAGAYLAAIRRDQEFLGRLESAALVEEDAQLKDAFEKCIAVLRGGDAAQLDALLTQYTGSDIPRDRLL